MNDRDLNYLADDVRDLQNQVRSGLLGLERQIDSLNEAISSLQSRIEALEGANESGSSWRKQTG